MSTATYACYADTVSIDFVKKHCPNEFKEFIQSLEKIDLCLDDFASGFIGGYPGGIDEEKMEKIKADEWEKLVTAFDRETGLELGLIYHIKEDRGDEIDGPEFTVEGVYVLTPEGKKHIDSIQRKTWTVWG